jgi:hypothetical protein
MGIVMDYWTLGVLLPATGKLPSQMVLLDSSHLEGVHCLGDLNTFYTGSANMKYVSCLLPFGTVEKQKLMFMDPHYR